MKSLGTFQTHFHSTTQGLSQPDPRTTPLIFPLYNDKHNSLEIISCFGKVASKRTNEVWCYSSKFNNWSLFLAWTQKMGENENRGPYISPAPRSASAGCLVDDNFYTFGGTAGIAPLDGLWVLDVIERVWFRIRPKSKAQLWPRARCAHSLVHGTGSLYLFGGWNTRSTLNDLWKFDLKTEIWTCLLGDSKIGSFKDSQIGLYPDPPKSIIFRRSSHTMVYIEKTHSLLIFGGWDLSHSQSGSGAKGPWKSLVHVDLTSLKVSFITSKSQNLSHNIDSRSPGASKTSQTVWPSARRSHAACMVAPYTMMIYGGLDRRRNFLNDGWFFDIRTKIWDKISFSNCDSHLMPDLAHHTLTVYHPSPSITQVFFFGGEGLQGRHIHLWSISFDSFSGPDDPFFFQDLKRLAEPGFPGDAFAMSSDYIHFVDESSSDSDSDADDVTLNKPNVIAPSSNSTLFYPKQKQNFGGSVALHPSLLSARSPALFKWVQNPSSWDRLIYACGFPLHICHQVLEKDQNVQILSTFGKFIYSGDLDTSFTDITPPPKWTIATLTTFWLTLSTCIENAPQCSVLQRLYSFLTNSLWERIRQVPFFSSKSHLENGNNSDDDDDDASGTSNTNNPSSSSSSSGHGNQNVISESTPSSSTNIPNPTENQTENTNNSSSFHPSYISLENKENSIPDIPTLSLSSPSSSSINTDNDSHPTPSTSSKPLHSLKSPRIFSSLSRFKKSSKTGPDIVSLTVSLDINSTTESNTPPSHIPQAARNLEVAGAIADLNETGPHYDFPIPSFFTSGCLFDALRLLLQFGSDDQILTFSTLLADCHDIMTQKSFWIPRIQSKFPPVKVQLLFSKAAEVQSLAITETDTETETENDPDPDPVTPKLLFTPLHVTPNIVFHHYSKLIHPKISIGKIGAPDFNLISGISMHVIDSSLYSLLHPGHVQSEEFSAEHLVKSIATNRPPTFAAEGEAQVFTDSEALNLADQEIFSKFLSGVLDNTSPQGTNSTESTAAEGSGNSLEDIDSASDSVITNGSITSNLSQSGFEFYSPKIKPIHTSTTSDHSPMLSWLTDSLIESRDINNEFIVAPEEFETPFRVSKCLLAARSKFFYGLFSSKMMESSSKAFVIQHYHPGALLAFINWVYTGFFSCKAPDSFLFAHASPFYFPSKSSLIRSFAKTLLFSPLNSLYDLFNLFKFISFAAKGSPAIQPFLSFVLVSIARKAREQDIIPPYILRLLAIHSTELSSFVSTVGEPLRTQLIHERMNILTEYLQRISSNR